MRSEVSSAESSQIEKSPTAQIDLARIHAGDEREIRRLIDILWLPLVRSAQLVLADTEAAGELAQEVLIRLVSPGSRIDFKDPAKIWPYALRMVRNMAVHQRHRFRRSERAAAVEQRQLELAEVAEASSDDDAEQIRAALETALTALPESQRQLVVLRYVEGRSFAEIAELLHTDAASIRHRVFRATDALRRLLSQTAADAEASYD